MTDNFESATEPVSPVVAPPSGPKTIESKLVVSTALATVLYAILQVVSDNTAVLDFLPVWAQTIVLAVLPTLLAFAAGWRTPSNRA